jgi:pilus assembly protein FimV
LFALGLGEIHPNSALSQPFDAEIELVNPTAEELGSLKVAVASADIYARLRQEKPAYLSTFVFKVIATGDGRAVVRVTSTRSVTEPVVTMQVEATWAGGRSVHEYTVFLDPPVFMPVQPAPSVPAAREEPRPAAPPPTDEARTAGVIERQPEPAPIVPPPVSRTPEPTVAAEPPVATTPAPVTPAPTPAPSEPTPTASEPPQAAPSPTLSGESYEVQRRDTLWQIANRIRPGTPQMINQTMIALYRANPSAFVGSNINRLRAGIVLRIPTDDDLLSVDVREANAEVARQFNEWRPQGAANGADSGRLQLVTPTEQPAQAPSAAEQAASTKSAQETKAAEEAAAKSAASAKAKADADAEAKRLIDLKNEDLARMQREREQQAAAEAEAAKKAAEAQKAAGAQTQPAPAVTPEPAPTPAETTAVTEKKPAPTPETTTAEPSILDSLGDLPWTYVLIGLGVIVLGFGVIAYSRRRQQPQTMQFPLPDSGGGIPTMTPADFEAALDRGSGSNRTRASTQDTAFEDPRTMQVEALSEDVDTTKPLHQSAPTAELPARAPLRSADDTMSSETPMHVDQQDALAEADFHMAYGLYDQAADLIKIAIQREPGRRDLKFKLLEIFFVWGNKDSFVDAARDLYQTRDVAPAGEWDRILVMGKQIAPENPMFKGGAQHVGDMIDVNLEGGENRVDIDLFAAPEGGDTGSNLDFEVGNTGSRSKPGSLDFLLDETANRKPTAGLDDTREMDSNARTQETPTIESPMLDATAERPMDRAAFSKVGEQTIRERTVALKFDQENSLAPATDQTAELSIDDLGLDVGGLESTGSLDQPAALSDQIGDDEMTRIARAPAMTPSRPSSQEPTMEVPAMGLDQSAKRGNGHDDSEDEGVSTIYLEQIANDQGEFVDTLGPNSGDTAMLGPEDLDLDLAKLGEASRLADEDTIRRKARIQTGNEPTAEMPVHRPADMSPTVEQPRPKLDRAELVATTQLPEMEPVTMSEVGTKLDLARAYMDMGDPDGARSILEEVLGEGNSGQRAEAQRLLDSIR